MTITTIKAFYGNCGIMVMSGVCFLETISIAIQCDCTKMDLLRIVYSSQKHVSDAQK